MLLVGGFGLFFDDEELRRRVVTTVFDNVPLSADADRARLERTVDDALDNTGRLGPVSVVLLIVAASGVMGALRHAINQAWDIHTRPPLLRRKALDLALVLGAATVLVFSVSLSATREAADWLGDAGWALDVVGDLLPFAFTTAVVLFLYRVLPSPRPKTREIWPGAVVAAALISLVRGVLELYFEHLADLGALYGSLGALMALLIFVYAVSLVLVFGAEYASEWSRLPKTRARNSLKSSRGAPIQGVSPLAALVRQTPFVADEVIASAVSPPLNKPRFAALSPGRAAGR